MQMRGNYVRASHHRFPLTFSNKARADKPRTTKVSPICALARDVIRASCEVLYLPRILHECEDTLIIDKPVGIPFHGNEDSPGIVQVVRSMQRDGSIGYQGALHPVHRLDRVTSGILVFAKSSAAAGALVKEFRAHRVIKYYTALSGRKPTKKMGRVVGDMERSRRSSWKLLRTATDPAITHFMSFPPFEYKGELLLCNDYSSSARLASDSGITQEVEEIEETAGTEGTADTPLQQVRMFVLRPSTGRTHQLRVAMKSLAAPVLGDPLYSNAAEAKKHSRTYLHATAIRFRLGGATIQVVHPPTYGELFACSEFRSTFEQLFPAGMAGNTGLWFPELPILKSELHPLELHP